MTEEQINEIKTKVDKIKQIAETFINEELSPRFSQFARLGFLYALEREINAVHELIDKKE